MASDSDSRATPLAAVNITALALASTVTALRCFVRVRLIKAFGVDDWLMVGAATSFVFYCSFSLAGIASGTGQHEAALTKEATAMARKWWWFCYPTYAVTMVLTKLSIACFFRRIVVERVHKWILALATSVTLVSCVIFFFGCIFQCWPVSYFWDKYDQTGTCIPDRVVIALAMLFSIISIITDFMFALMPAWILSRVHMKRKTKVALNVLMGLGCVASTAVVVRLPDLRFISSDDFLYDTVDVAIWSTVEQGLAITAGGLATLQPLVRLIAFKLGLGPRPSLPSNRYDDNNNNNNGNNMPMKRGCGRISVKRSVAHRTEPARKQYDHTISKLQPCHSGYSARCYNTSEEALQAPGST